MVTKKDVCETLKSLGVKNGDILLFHSSLKSFGEIENGADTVIDGALEAVGEDGTLVAPALLTKSFYVAYEIFDKNTSPCEVGLIPETMRKRPNALRSDQATHSVSAIGKMAEFLTNSHSTSKPRKFPYGDYAFSHGSPWQKMYDLPPMIVVNARTKFPMYYDEWKWNNRTKINTPWIKKIKLFGFIPLIKIKQKHGQKKVYLFDVIQLVRIKKIQGG